MPILNVKETAVYLNIPLTEAVCLVRSKGFPSFKILDSWRIHRDLLDKWAKNERGTIMKVDDSLLTTQEAGDYLRISERSMYKLVKTEGFPAFKTLGGWRIPKYKLDQWIAQQIKDKENYVNYC